MNERIDELLSARRDGRLEAPERAELDRLLAASETARRRAEQFERIDASLRSFAERSVADERLDHNLAALRRRVAAGSSAGARGVETRLPERVRIAPYRLRALAVGGAAAALVLAAVWIAAVLVPMPQPPDAGERLVAGDLAPLAFEESGDLEVIEELDLLDFLAAREQRDARPRG